jgi:hypothetical protein
MTPKEALDKIKALFAEPAPEQPEAEPAAMEAKEYVLEGGAKVLISELEPGGMASLVDDAGNASPAPAGDHTLADGTVITVGENGLLSGVKMPEVQPEMPEAEMAQLREELSAVKSENERIAALLAETLKRAEFEASVKDLTEKLKGLAEAVTSVLETPSVEPMQAPKDKFERNQPSKDERMAVLLQTLDNLKNK